MISGCPWENKVSLTSLNLMSHLTKLPKIVTKFVLTSLRFDCLFFNEMFKRGIGCWQKTLSSLSLSLSYMNSKMLQMEVMKKPACWCSYCRCSWNTFSGFFKCTHLNHFCPVSIHYLKCICCLLHYAMLRFTSHQY